MSKFNQSGKSNGSQSSGKNNGINNGKNDVKNGKSNGGTMRTIVIIVVTAVVVTIILGSIAWWQYSGFEDKVVFSLHKAVEDSCKNSPPAVYRNVLMEPKQNGIYEKEVATSLWDIGGAVSLANCQDISLPPPFTNFRKIYVIDTSMKNSDGQRMIAHIFWNNNNESEVCVAFTGTYFPTEWFNNIRMLLVTPTSIIGSQEKFRLDDVDIDVDIDVDENQEVEDLLNQKGVQIHQGFYELYDLIRPQLLDFFQNINIIFKNIYITGRSMGGALSTIFAYDISLNSSHFNINKPNIIHYSFASPRVGNISFSNDFDMKVPTSIRVYNTEDPVVQMPPAAGTDLLAFNIPSLGLSGGNLKDILYQHVCAARGAKGFTLNVGTLFGNHVDAYYDLPT